MIVIGKRLKYLFILEIVVASVLIIAGILLLNVTDDGSTTVPAIVIFSIAALLLLLAILDLTKEPNDIILYDNEKKELLIDFRGKITFPMGTKVIGTKYYVIPIADIIQAICVDSPEGGRKSFGAMGYAASVKSINQLTITYKIPSNNVDVTVKNINDVENVKKKILKLVNTNRNKEVDNVIKEIKNLENNSDKSSSIVKNQEIEDLFLLTDNREFSVALNKIFISHCIDNNPNYLNHTQKTLFLCIQIENNGQEGTLFNFFKHYSNFVYELVEALYEIDAPKSAELITQAIGLFSKYDVPVDFSDGNLQESMTKLDQEFFYYPDGCMVDLCRRYAEKNLDNLSIFYQFKI